MKSLRHGQTHFLLYTIYVLSILALSALLFFAPMLSNIDTKLIDKKNRPTVSVFYNLYASNETINNAKKIVIEQMSHVRPEHRVFVRSIGVPFPVDNATLIQHDNTGWEKETLKLLWEHCRAAAVRPKTNKSDETVVYIHSKGSFHSNSKNDLLRQLITQAALSEDCANMPPFCNVCSFRMSPLPHPHTPGNMWSAKCDYVNKLMNPVNFEEKMNEYFHARNLRKEGFADFGIGAGRYAAEHWVHSHPTIRACDLSTSDFVFGYYGLPQINHEMKLMRAPRYEIDAYVVKSRDVFWMKQFHSKKRYFQVDARLDEYKFLYNETPPQTWFGWSLYNETGVTNPDWNSSKGGRPSLLNYASLKAIAREMQQHDGRSYGKKEINDMIVHQMRKVVSDAGFVPLNVPAELNPNTLNNYIAELSLMKELAIVEKSIVKTNTRFAAENSIRGSISNAALVGATHFIAVDEDEETIQKTVDNLPEDARLLYDMVRKARPGLPLVPVKMPMVLSTDDTTQFIFEGEENKPDKFRLAPSTCLEGRGTKSIHHVSEERHMNGMRVKLTWTFSACGRCAPLFVTVTGLSESEFPGDDDMLIVKIPGLCIGGGVGGNQEEGYLCFQRGTYGVDQKRFEYYQKYIVLPFINRLRKECSGFEVQWVSCGI